MEKRAEYEVPGGAFVVPPQGHYRVQFEANARGVVHALRGIPRGLEVQRGAVGMMFVIPPGLSFRSTERTPRTLFLWPAFIAPSVGAMFDLFNSTNEPIEVRELKLVVRHDPSVCPTCGGEWTS